MKVKTISAFWDRTNLNAINYNFSTVLEEIDESEKRITSKLWEETKNENTIKMLKPVRFKNELPTSAEPKTLITVLDEQKIYVFVEGEWQVFNEMEFDPAEPLRGKDGRNGIDGQDGVIRFEDLAPEQKELFTKGQVILEHPIKGYPPRHDISYVTWIGVNAPQEAEVFDEWRQIPGFVYFTDFHTVNDWVKKDTDIVNVEKVLDDNEDAMLIETRGGSRKSLLWDNIKITKDLEIYFSGKKRIFSSGQTISALLKYTNEELIFCGPFDKELRVTKINLITGKSTILYQTTHNVDVYKKFHLIARIDGNSFKSKIWQDGMKEPKDWQINGNSDEVVVESQNVGIYTFIYGKDIIYKFGVGTNGMRAPHREVY